MRSSVQTINRTIIAIVLITSGATAEERTASELFEAGRRAIDRGQSSEARRLLEACLARDPQQDVCRVALGRIYLDDGATERAMETLAPLTGSDDVEGLRLLAEACLRLDRLSEARDAYRQIVRLVENSADDRMALGQIYLREGRYGLAAVQLQEAERLGLSSGPLHFALATAQAELENYLGDLRIVRIEHGRCGGVADGVLLIAPVDGEPDSFLAAPADSAIYHVQRALDAGLDTLEVRLAQAGTWLRGRRYAEAVAAYAALEPRMAEAEVSTARRVGFCLEFAEALYGADDIEGYFAKVQQAVNMDIVRLRPRFVEACTRAAERYNQRGDLARYIHYLELAVAESPKAEDLHYKLGNAYWEAGQGRSAARQWQMALQLHPDHPDRSRMLEWIQIVRSEDAAWGAARR